jgi:hypothetical protein
MVASKRTIWDEYDIGQCINLSLSNMARNESMLIAASYFWSDTLNAFLFGHGPMTPTLPDVLMLTGLNILAPDYAYSLITKPSHRLETKNIGGWKGYIDCHARTWLIRDREHTAFLNMWLEKFIFSKKNCRPDHQHAIYSSIFSHMTLDSLRQTSPGLSLLSIASNFC